MLPILNLGKLLEALADEKKCYYEAIKDVKICSVKKMQ